MGTYYGGTSLATLPAPQEAHVVTVAMTENNGNNVIVASATGFTVAGVYFPPGQVALDDPGTRAGVGGVDVVFVRG